MYAIRSYYDPSTTLPDQDVLNHIYGHNYLQLGGEFNTFSVTSPDLDFHHKIVHFAGETKWCVITSYSIHYTKLYDQFHPLAIEDCMLHVMQRPKIDFVITSYSIHYTKLYEHYPAPGDRELSKQIGDLFADNNLPYEMSSGRGLDHGVWVLLRMLFPKADVPVVELSVDSYNFV